MAEPSGSVLAEIGEEVMGWLIAGGAFLAGCAVGVGYVLYQFKKGFRL